MYCTTCGQELSAQDTFCRKCGSKVVVSSSSTASDAVDSKPNQAKSSGNGPLALTFGILSVVFFGPLLGIPAWILGAMDLRKIRAGLVDATKRGLSTAGMVLGIVGTFLTTAIIIVIVLVVATTVFATTSILKSSNEAALSSISPQFNQKSSLDYFSDIEEIRGQTADNPPAIFLIKISLGYNPANSAIPAELGGRKRQIQSLVLTAISQKGAKDLSADHYPSLKVELMDIINSVMKDGKVEDITFGALEIQK